MRTGRRTSIDTGWMMMMMMMMVAEATDVSRRCVFRVPHAGLREIDGLESHMCIRSSSPPSALDDAPCLFASLVVGSAASLVLRPTDSLTHSAYPYHDWPMNAQSPVSKKRPIEEQNEGRGGG
eukprot:GHVU01012398.1.p2 GENE.GHVU01012398.1~~GHVU01012398.1.p2  ORF type:complete len:123 (+),score=11.20 GHVU01012398.1:483-851(+)